MISGTKLTMQAPKLSGYTRDGRWYELIADSAAQDITKPEARSSCMAFAQRSKPKTRA